MDHGPLMKWLPRAQSAQQDYAAEESDCAPGERNEYGFGEESPQNAPSARSESEPKSDFPGTVSGARGEQTAQVSARGQQNERRQQHQACQKCPYRTAKIIAIKAWTSQGKGYIAFIFGVSLFQICTDGVQVGSRLCRSDSRLQMSDRLKYPTDPACVQVISRVHLLMVHNRHEKVGIEKQQSPMERRRRYTEDGERMLVQLNHTAYHAVIILKMAV